MEIPLFPLPNLVLFPRIVVPLHIFEERYKLMINSCIDSGDVFGLVLLRAEAEEESEETIHKVGVTARVVEVERLEGGRMNIVCEGESRFRIRRFTEKSPYWKADVEVFEDRAGAPESLSEQVAELYRSVMGSETEAVVLPESPEDLSYLVSYVLDIDSEEKQTLLELDSTAERLRMLIAHLTEVIRRLEERRVKEEMIRKVRGNGHLRS
jgi:Lon protease-like protein